MPANYSYTLAVSAMGQNDKIINHPGWWGSTYGEEIDFTAPGENISTSLYTNNYAMTNKFGGTSASAPFISAACALVKVEHPDYTRDQVKQVLINNCVDLGTKGKDIYYGYGVPDFNNGIFEADPTSKIEMAKLPTKINYVQNIDKLDLSGGTIKVTYLSGKTETKALTTKGIDVTGFNNSKIGKNTLTVKYNGKTVTFTVNIVTKTLNKITIGTLPKTSYYKGESLSLVNGSIKAYYNDNSIQTIPLSNCSVSGFNGNKLGSQTLTVKYGDKTTNFTIKVNEDLSGSQVQNSYSNSVNWAINQKILLGDGKDYGLNNGLTRAEGITFIYRFAGSPSVSGSNKFKDVSSNAYYYKPVLWGTNKGIVNGTTSTTFSPNNVCTRGAFITFLHRYAGRPSASTSTKYSNISDFNQPTNWALNKGIITRTIANNIDRTITREEAINILYNYYNIYLVKKQSTTTTTYLDQTKYAQTVTVVFNSNNGTTNYTKSVTVGDAIGTLPTPTKNGYDFDGWYTSSSGGSRIYTTTKVSKATVYYAHWTAKTVYITILFSANGGSTSYTKTIVAGNTIGSFPTSPTRSGYTFLGWYTSSSGGSKIYTTTKVSSNVTFYAHWEKEKVTTYTITFFAYDGSYSRRTINAGSKIGTLPSATRSGYTFLGWYTTVSGGTKITSSTIPPGSRTYYAHWQKNITTNTTKTTTTTNKTTTTTTKTNNYSTSVNWALNRGIIEGYGNGNLGLSDTLRRKDALVLIYRLAGSPNVSGSTGFADVSSGAYYAKAVIWANKKGIIKGTGSGNFSPDSYCSRGAFVTFLHRYAGSPSASTSTKYSSISDFNKPTNWALNKGLITSNQAIYIDNNINRQLAIDILYAYYNKYM